MRFAGDDRDTVLLLSPIGGVRNHLILIQEDLQKTKLGQWKDIQREDGWMKEMTMAIILLAGYFAAYGCILVGLLTLEKPAPRRRPIYSRAATLRQNINGSFRERSR